MIIDVKLYKWTLQKLSCLPELFASPARSSLLVLLFHDSSNCQNLKEEDWQGFTIGIDDFPLVGLARLLPGEFERPAVHGLRAVEDARAKG